MADTSLNLLTLSMVASASGTAAGEGLLAAVSTPHLPANSNAAEAFRQFDKLLTQAQQQDTQQSGSQGNNQNTGNSQTAANGQNNASSAPASTQNASPQNRNQQQADNAQHGNDTPPSQPSSGSTQDASGTVADIGKGKDKSSSADAAAVVSALAGFFAFLSLPLPASLPQITPATGNAANDQATPQAAVPSQPNILSTLQALLAQLATELGISMPATQTTGAGQTNTSGQDAFLQLLQSALQAGGAQTANTNTSLTSLVASLQNLLQTGVQNLSPADMQQLTTLVTQLSAPATPILRDVSAVPAATTLSTQTDTQPQLSFIPANPTPANTAPVTPPPPTPPVQDVVHAALQPLLKQAVPPANTNTSPASTSSTNATSAPSAPLAALSGVSSSGSTNNSTGQDSGNTGQDGQPRGTLLSLSPLNVQPLNTPVGGNQTPFSQVLNQVQQPAQPSPVEQLVATVKTAAQNGESRIQIQLHPAELGWLNIRLEVTPEGHASMNVTADNPATLKMLSGDVKVLQQMLTDIGLKADAGSLSFNLRGDGQQGQGQNTGNGGQGYSGYRASTPTALDDAFAQATPQTYVMTATDGVDIRI